MAKERNYTNEKAAVGAVMGDIFGYKAGIAAKEEELTPLVEALIKASGGHRGPWRFGDHVIEFRKKGGPGNAGAGYAYQDVGERKEL